MLSRQPRNQSISTNTASQRLGHLCRQVSETSHESDTSEEEHVATGPPSHVEEMWRKHASVITPIAAEIHEEVASPPADAVPVNTAVESEESGSS